ncbi:fluoride efflux transporter CrcB [Clostridiaceae bacterium HSG29]|nr:fluoride efflux transporter CrcB [Clostridiaceae bacterium HSG29]
MRLIAVGCGGFIGASLRYLISGWGLKLFGGAFPYGTLLVNILGGFLIGFIMKGSMGTFTITPTMRIFLTTGLMGGLTTFSTFSYETIGMLEESNYLLGSLNVFLNLSFSLIGVYLGKMMIDII